MVRNDLDDVLMRRAMPPMRSNLAERIIAAMPPVQTMRERGLRAWLREFSDNLAIPKPAYALASVLFIGLIIGWAAAPQVEDTTDSISSYFYTNEVLNMGDWLL